MKPIHLVMSAFGPYSGEVSLPFRELADHGLFLITGDTGAGKTTIFDAIAFALFGEASGSVRTTETLRSDFASPDTKTFVELTFRHKGLAYVIRRNPAYERAKKSGTGTTNEPADARLLLPDGTWVSGSSRVTERILGLLGIDGDQFKQIAMIAQGEFLRLLLADSKDRALIFRTIFNTGLFAKVQERLKWMEKDIRGQCDSLAESLLQNMRMISLAPEGALHDELTELIGQANVHAARPVWERLCRHITQDEALVMTASEQSRMLDAEVSDLTSDISRAEMVNRQFEDLRKARDRNAQLSQDRPLFDQLEQTVEAAQKARYQVWPLQAAADREKNALMKLDEAIATLETELVRLEPEAERLYQALIGQQALDPRRDELGKSIGQLSASLPRYARMAELDQRVRADEEKQSRAIEEKNAQGEVGRKLDEEFVHLKADLSLLSDADVAYRDGVNRLAQWTQLGKDWGQVVKEVSGIDRLEAEYQNHLQACLQTERLFTAAEEQYRRQETRYLRNQAGLLAASLVDGEACPVCGSTDHPQKAHLEQDAPDEAGLKKSKQERDRLHQNWLAASQLAGHHLTEIKTRLDLASKQGAQLLEQAQAQFLSGATAEAKPQADRLTGVDWPVAYPADLDWTALLESLRRNADSVMSAFMQQLEAQKAKKEHLAAQVGRKNTLSERMAANESAKSKHATRLAELEADLNEWTASILANRKERDTLAGLLDYESLEEAKTQLHLQESELQRLKAELENARSQYEKKQAERMSARTLLNSHQQSRPSVENEYDKADQAFQTALREHGFADDAAYRAALLPDPVLKQQQDKLNEYRTETQRVSETIDRLERETAGLAPKDLVALHLSLDEKRAQRQAMGQTEQILHARLDRNRLIEAQMAQNLSKREEQVALFNRVSDLARTANGELAGRQKLAFEQYVQAAYFTQVITEANRRLSVMSANRYSLVRKSDASNLRSQSGLELEVLDQYTGKLRPVRTLSGGESFKASLAMALGLSDVIQRFAGGVEIDTLFIDEGFGSLDSESLEQAIATLSTLTSGNRLVGIISHVSELKERIDRQIRIRTGVDGSRIELSRR